MRQLYLTSAYRARQIVVLPDSDGIGGADIGVIAQRNSDGRLRMEIRNARGGGTTRAFFIQPVTDRGSRGDHVSHCGAGHRWRSLNLG